MRSRKYSTVPQSARRHRFRFSLRLLLLLCALIAMVLGLQAKKARDQQAAVELVEGLGGTVIYDFQPPLEERERRFTEEWERRRSGQPVVKYIDEPWAPAWLRELVGEHWFITVSEVNLSRTLVTDQQLHAISKLSGLRSLSLNGVVYVTDDGLAALESLRRLERLDLADNFWSGLTPGLTDEGLKHLQGLDRLKHLELSQNRFTGHGLQYIGSLKQLTELDLPATKVTTFDLQHLTELRNLELLRLNHLKYDRAFLERLQHFPKLRDLPRSLSESITDAGMPLVAQIEGLRQIDLRRTQVTDAGLIHLRSSPHLEWLGLDGTRLTDAGLRSLGQLPNLESLTVVPVPKNGGGGSMSLSAVTDAGLVDILAGANGLQSLYLEGTSVTDVTLKRLADHTTLRRLDLDGTKVTNSGLQSLSALQELEHLSLEDTEVTDEGISRLQRALPSCRISWSTPSEGN